MKVTESETHRCDIQLEDITEEEQQAMFLEGIKALVNEAREGKVGDYIVLPYEHTPESIKSSTTSTVEIDDETVDALVQIGAVSMLTKGMKLIKEEDEYYKKLKDFVDGDEDEEWDDERTNIIGQNGNDGLHYGNQLPLHYVNYGAGSREVDHIMKVDEKLEKEYWTKLKELPDDE